MIFTLFLIFIVSLLILFRPKREHKFPPGPFAWPVIGNVLEIGRIPHLSLAKLSQKYGKLFQVHIGPYRVYVLSDVELIREVFHNPVFSGRPHLEIVDILQGRPNSGLAFSHGDELIERRKFTLRHLRNFGFGKTATTEILVMEEINEVLANLRNCTHEPFILAPKFVFVVMNSLWTIIAGKRYSHDDPRLTYILDQERRIIDEISYSPAFFWPKLGEWFPKLTKWNMYLDFVRAMQDFVQEHIDEHKKHSSVEGSAKDLIDAYLQEIDRTSDETSGFYKETGLYTLRGTIMDLILGGGDTTTQTLAWLFLYVCKYPEVQRKMQEELDENVTCERVKLCDRPFLPYLEAVMLESFKISPVVPLGRFHAATQGTQLRGYDVPEGTWIIGNLHAAHLDKTIWGDPQNFRPERFLNSDGSLMVEKNDALMPFSVGKRACIGEQLARDTIFLIIANVFKEFSVTLAECSKDVGLDSKPGLVTGPEEYFVEIQQRS